MMKIINDLSKFYTTLIFVYFSDILLLISTILISYEKTKSPLFLGISMSISIAIPFLIKKFFKTINLLNLNLKNLYQLRLAIYFSIFLIVYFLGFHYITIIILSILIGILNLSALSCYEISNTQLVLLGKISSNSAARIMQTVIQVGSFMGAAFAGIILNKINISVVFYIISGIDMIASFLFLWLLKDFFKLISTQIESVSKNIPHAHLSTSSYGYFLFIAIGLIAAHIALFNFITPILLSEVKFLSSNTYGYLSASAGIGAFIASFLKFNSKILIIFPVLLFACDWLFGFSKSTVTLIIICFFIGFFINSIRIICREFLTDLAQNSLEAKLIGEKSAVIYFSFQSLTPIVFAFIILLLSSSIIKAMALCIVALCLIAILASIYLTNKQDKSI